LTNVNWHNVALLLIDGSLSGQRCALNTNWPSVNHCSGYDELQTYVPA
jgi:hypothetical protein